MIRVLIVDDSTFVRKVFTRELSKDPEINVVGAAPNPIVSEEMIQKYDPDIIILDIEMPKMDGLTYLKNIMNTHPRKVIVVSSLAEEGGEVALRSLELGAFEVLAKPGNDYSVEEMTDQLIDRIKAVHQVSFEKNRVFSLKAKADHKLPINKTISKSSDRIILIGASTGGTGAIQYVLERMPKNCPPILIVQHMPQYFTKSFANRLNDVCEIKVKEAENREIIEPGKALIAPGHLHMELTKSNEIYNVCLMDGPLMFRQKPAVERLFLSAALCAGQKAIGVILTGMGRDGSTGLLEMKKAGAYTIAQDEESCVVFGMPKEAIELGAVDKIVSLSQIADEIIREATR